MFSFMPTVKPIRLERPIKFDDAMRGLVRVPPPPSGKKAKRAKTAPKKQNRKSR
jgi:hypothetical protein